MRRTSQSIATLALTALALAAAAPAPAAAQGTTPSYVVVVNAANPLTSLSKGDLAKIFLKKVDRWSNGQQATPVNLGDTSPARERFTRDILGKSITALESYWQQQIFSGKNVPPVSKASDAEVIEFVRANPGAVGYVSAKAADAPGVKRLGVTS
jgi:ABC-type phosphate transport system substrate-binding protein